MWINQGQILGKYKGPATGYIAEEITNEEGIWGEWVVVQMETDIINLAEIEIYIKPQNGLF